MASPFGDKMNLVTGELKDKEFMINVKEILRQTRAGQFCLMNSAIGAPKRCISETASQARVAEQKAKDEAKDEDY